MAINVYGNGVYNYADKSKVWETSAHLRKTVQSDWWVDPFYNTNAWGNDVAIGFLKVPFDVIQTDLPTPEWTQTGCASFPNTKK